MPINATPGSPDANSFATLEEVTAILVVYSGAETWAGTDPGKQERCIVTAAQELANKRWKGAPATTEQAMPFPMTGLCDQYRRVVPSDTIPAWLKRAQAIYAHELLTADRQTDARQPQQIKVASINIKFDVGQTRPRLPQSVQDIINPYICTGTTVVRA